MPTLKAYVIRCDAGTRASEIVAGIQDSSIEEIVLKLDTKAPKCPDTGLALEFEAMPVSYVKDPFRMTVGVESKSIRGW